MYTTIYYFLQGSSIFINADTIQHLSSYVNQSVLNIDGHLIKFFEGSANDRLFEVPVVDKGELDIHATLRVTVAVQPPTPTHSTDRDPIIGLVDGVEINAFMLHDQSNYGYTSCQLLQATHDITDISTLTAVTQQYTLIFKPYSRYGACVTAQSGGYVNTGRFNSQLDVSQSLHLVVQRNNAGEDYTFNYILIEIL